MASTKASSAEATAKLQELLAHQQRLEARVDAVGAEERAAVAAAREAL
jgi:hypothetical protein